MAQSVPGGRGGGELPGDRPNQRRGGKVETCEKEAGSGRSTADLDAWPVACLARMVAYCRAYSRHPVIPPVPPHQGSISKGGPRSLQFNMLSRCLATQKGWSAEGCDISSPG